MSWITNRLIIHYRLRHKFSHLIIPSSNTVNNKKSFFTETLMELLQRGTAMSRHEIEILQLHYHDRLCLSRAYIHAPLGNCCSDMFAFPHSLRKLSKLPK